MARILDLAPLPAVYAGRLLAESGNDVIRIESPVGDDVRRQPPFLGDDTNLEHGSYHQFFNAGKRSLALNLTSPEGLDVFARLAATADAVIGSQPPPISAEELHNRFPRLIVVAIDDDGAPEICQYARSGLLSITGHPGATPVLMGGHVLYAASGLWVGMATATAMLVQVLSGQGQIVTFRLQDCFETFLEQGVATYSESGRPTERRGYRGAVTAVSGAFPAVDGHWMISVGTTAQSWARLMDWVQDPVLMADASLADEAGRRPKQDFILDRIGAWASEFKKQDAVDEAQRRHVPSAPVSTPQDLAADPQLISRGFLTEVDYLDFGRHLFPVGAIASVLGMGITLAPSLGQHNGEILSELGYSADEQRLLFERAVI